MLNRILPWCLYFDFPWGKLLPHAVSPWACQSRRVVLEDSVIDESPENGKKIYRYRRSHKQARTKLRHSLLGLAWTGQSCCSQIRIRCIWVRVVSYTSVPYQDWALAVMIELIPRACLCLCTIVPNWPCQIRYGCGVVRTTFLQGKVSSG